MFGIGLPELILIMALALIVVGPDKLPDMAKSIAKQLLELKKTANALKESLQDELKEDELKKDDPRPWERLEPPDVKGEIIEAGGNDISVQPKAEVPSSVEASAPAEDAVPYEEDVRVESDHKNEAGEQEGKKS